MSRSRLPLLHSLAILAALSWPTAADAAAYRWLTEFTEGSDPALAALHEEIHTPRLDEAIGSAVEDLHWTEESFDLHLKSGTLYLEPPVDGYPAGAFFTGDATVTFAPGSQTARQDLEFWFGAPTVESFHASHVLFFTLRGASLREQLGIESEPTIPFRDREAYEEGKAALGQLGTDLLHAFLNRSGRSRGASWVLMTAEALRTQGSDRALLLYSFDPGRSFEIELAVAGHREVAASMPHRNYFWSVARSRSAEAPFQPQGRVTAYRTDLEVGNRKYSSEEETTIEFTPADGLSALRLSLTPRMEVERITGPGGRDLPFLQWEHQEGEPNFDPHVLVVDERGFPAGEEMSIRVASSGSLFEPYGSIYWLAAEDHWLPMLDDPRRSIYELRFTVPAKKTAIGSGILVANESLGDQKRYHFRTKRPYRRSTIYFGDYVSRSIEAEGTTIEAYIARIDARGKQNLDFVLDELREIVALYSELFGPLDTDTLRVTGTPTAHGRGFEGLILLGASSGFASAASDSDLFRAHEVAHQWWGNVVQPRNWPHDRWISEAFAAYAAMEYYDRRFAKPGKTLERIYADWFRPVLEQPVYSRRTLLGEPRQERGGERFALIDGGSNVYTKGPAVLHMLRYLFECETGSDEAFWALLADFLGQHRYQQVRTVDFTSLAQQHLGQDLGWFWQQWLYDRAIPHVRWTQDARPDGDGWLLTVKAEQQGTDYRLLIPVTVELRGGRTERQTLRMEGSAATLEVRLPEKPRKVLLNDTFQALIDLKG